MWGPICIMDLETVAIVLGLELRDWICIIKATGILVMHCYQRPSSSHCILLMNINSNRYLHVVLAFNIHR